MVNTYFVLIRGPLLYSYFVLNTKYVVFGFEIRRHTSVAWTGHGAADAIFWVFSTAHTVTHTHTDSLTHTGHCCSM